MRTALLAAAVLTVLLAAAHSYLGERYILMRLFRRADLPKLFGGTAFTQDTLRFAWHVTSVAFAGFAALLVAMADNSLVQPAVQGRIIAATFAASGLVALIGSRARHLSWIVFFTVAVLAYSASL